MTRNEALTGPIRPGQESVNTQRRMFVGGALAAIMATPRLAVADDDKTESPNDPFILLLHGIYQPVPAGSGPKSNLGLTSVNLNDGSYSTTQIYPVFGIGGNNGEDNLPNKPIGTFYVQFAGNKCAYDLPGGSIAMQFNDPVAGVPLSLGFNGFVPFPDGAGGAYLEGTFELVILEATGVYSKFKGGHNHMVDRLHALANGQANEFCFCNISTYQFP
jgi:hypothetical protein